MSETINHGKECSFSKVLKLHGQLLRISRIKIEYLDNRTQKMLRGLNQMPGEEKLFKNWDWQSRETIDMKKGFFENRSYELKLRFMYPRQNFAYQWVPAGSTARWVRVPASHWVSPVSNRVNRMHFSEKRLCRTENFAKLYWEDARNPPWDQWGLCIIQYIYWMHKFAKSTIFYFLLQGTCPL